MLRKKKETPPEQEPGGQMRETLEAPEPRSGSGRRRLLLLVLLLVVAGGALYFQFGVQEPEPPPPARPAAVSQPIAMPVPTPPPVPVEGSREKPAEAQPSVAAAEKGVAPAVTATAAEKAPAEAPAPAATAPVAAVAPQATAARAAFALQAGPFLLPGQLAEAERTVRALGHEPARAKVSEPVTLTRLLLGVYPSGEAPERLREAKARIPDAFPLRFGDDVALYAGSFHDVDRARIFADLLYEQGIEVEEQSAQVVLDVDVLRFGAFADEREAQAALKAVQQAGLQGRLVPLR